jgi:arylsulfatase A-like enzyme
MGFADASVVLLISASTIFILLGLPLLLVLFAGEAFSKKIQDISFIAAKIIAGFILATLILLLVDNFTYTIFGFGISTSDSTWTRLCYLFLWVFLLAYFIRAGQKKSLFSKENQWVLFVYILIIMVGIFLMLSTFNRDEVPVSIDRFNKDEKDYNVLIISSDGLEASNMSVYGYNRDTTPFLRSISRELLISENSFVNNANTPGSIISLLTGMLPTTTGVVYPPDILNGLHSFRHWPGIMLRNGYKTLDISVRKFADAFDLNLRDGFLEANFRSIAGGSINNIVPKWYQIKFPGSAYFIQTIADKITSSLSHILFIKEINNAYDEVAQKIIKTTDRTRLDEIKRYIDMNEKYFIHAHLMGTHGSKFHINNDARFSIGKSQDEKWMIDFYDDTILRFDKYIEEIYRYLEDKDLLKKTILIIHSDHGLKWKDGKRVPLIIRFPGKEYTGKFSSNTQSIDIAPTILKYLNIEVPEWMQGQNFLDPGDEYNIGKPIFSASITHGDCNFMGRCAVAEPDPDFGTIGYMSVVICNRYYQLNLKSGSIKSNLVKGHTGECLSSDVADKVSAGKLIVNHLYENGYDVSRKELSKYIN